MSIVWFQPERLKRWLKACFPGETIDIEERILRFGEESLELLQSEGVTREQALALVKQVFDKEPGDPYQELGGVTVTLAAYCAIKDADAGWAFETEMTRVENPIIMAKIREKHLTKAVVSSKHRADRTQ